MFEIANRPRRARASLALACFLAVVLCPSAGAAVTNAYVLYRPSVSSAGVSQFGIGAEGAPFALTPTSMTTADGPLGGALSPDGANLYVAHADGSGTVSQFTVNDNGTLVPKLPPTVTAGSYATSVAVSSDGAHVYVGGDVGVTHFAVGADGALTAGSPTSLPAGGYAVRLSPDGASLYALDFASDSQIWQLTVGPGGALTPKTPASVDAGFKSSPLVLAPDGDTAYAAGSGDVVGSSRPRLIFQYSVAPDGRLTPLTPPTVDVGNYVSDLAVAADSQSLYASVAGGTVAQFDIAGDGSLGPKSPASLSVGGLPNDLAIDSAGASLYVTDVVGETLTRYPISAGGLLGAATASQATGAFPGAVLLRTPTARPAPPLRGPSGPPAGAGTAPTANAVATPGARRSGGQTFGFDGSLSTDADGRIVAYAWTLGGKVVSTQPQFSRFLSKTKRSYRVTLTVTDDTGLTGSTTVTVSARAKRAPVVRIVVPGTARFCYACFRLSPSARHLMSALRRYARAARTVTISSYADSTGAPGHNLALTRRRTRSVADALLGGLAPRPSRTGLHWYGSHHPVASNTTAAGRGRNRRTEIRIVR